MGSVLINGKTYDDNDVAITIDMTEVILKEINFSDVAPPWTHAYNIGSAGPGGATQGKSGPKGDLTMNEGEAANLALRAALTNTIKFSSIVIQYATKTVDGANIIKSWNPLNADRILDGIMWGPDKTIRQAGGEITPKFNFIAAKIEPAVSV